MKIEFLEEAQFELDESIEYYNREEEGPGDDFLQEVLNSLDRIAHFPEASHPLSQNTRRCQTRRFPYGTIYTAVGGQGVDGGGHPISFLWVTYSLRPS